MSMRKTSTGIASKKRASASSAPAPVVHQQPETEHADGQPKDHPQGDKQRSRSPSAEDTRVNDGGRSGSEGDAEMGTSEEDARSRRRDLGA